MSLREVVPPGHEARVLDATEIMRELTLLQVTLPTLMPMINALAYCVIALEHVLQHLHDDEPTQN